MVWIQSCTFPIQVVLSKATEKSLSYYVLVSVSIIDGFMPFAKALVLKETGIRFVNDLNSGHRLHSKPRLRAHVSHPAHAEWLGLHMHPQDHIKQHKNIYVYIYIYIYMCVCVCVLGRA